MKEVMKEQATGVRGGNGSQKRSNGDNGEIGDKTHRNKRKPNCLLRCLRFLRCSVLSIRYLLAPSVASPTRYSMNSRPNRATLGTSEQLHRADDVGAEDVDRARDARLPAGGEPVGVGAADRARRARRGTAP